MVLLAEVTKNPEFSPESSFAVRHRRAFVSSSYSQGFLFGGKIMEHLCECGCGERVKWNKQYKRWNRFIKGHHGRSAAYWKTQGTPQLCECGCGKYAKGGDQFIYQHNRRGSRFWKLQEGPQLCACGCGEYANLDRIFIYGHQNNGREFTKEHRDKIAESKKNQSTETKQKIASTLKGHIVTEETRLKISVANTNPSEETRKLMAKAGRNRTAESNLKMAITKMKCRSGEAGYCDQWYDEEYKVDLRCSACEECGITNMMSIKLFGCSLSNHHIDGNKMNCHPSNFKTLCNNCHPTADAELRKELL